MWSVITKIFTKNSNNEGGTNLTLAEAGAESEDMDDTKQAKQRASMKWLLSKAFNNQVPENLKEPFYRDSEDQERLKPQIIGALANAELYCAALGNIYSDPNYHNLNHWSILQALSRKGVYVSEPSDTQLTETTLIQTNPLRINSHMAVIELIMILYAKEVVSSDRVQAAVQRFTNSKNLSFVLPENHEHGLFMWLSHACAALKRRIEQDSNVINGSGLNDRSKINFPSSVSDLKDLGDGVALAALISYYCPEELPWMDIKVSYVPNVQDSLHNLTLVKDFCKRCLPNSIFHIQPEDLTYMRNTMKQNLIVFLADLFNVIEIHPVQCVKYQGMENINNVYRSSAHLPLRKTNSLQQSFTDMSEDSLRRGSEDSFIVHRTKNIPTLRSVVQDEPLIPSRLRVNKEKQNNDSKSDERGEVAAGRPSNWEDCRKSTFAGRRSRRNSTSDDSQLTIENFGGSQDNLNFIGRNPDKEVAVHVGRKISAPSLPIENPAVRSSLQDARGTLQLGYNDDDGCEKIDNETEKFHHLKRQLSSDDISLRNLLPTTNKKNLPTQDETDSTGLSKRFSEFNNSKSKTLLGSENQGIQLVYMQPDKEELQNKLSHNNEQTNNTTTWQQQSNNIQQNIDSNGGRDSNNLAVNPAQLNDVRLKLEEKRRLIESEKKRLELAMNKQRQKVGKAAFLQAVAREINDDPAVVERKWLNEGQPYIETRKTPDLENMDMEQYQQSIAQMNSSLSDIHTDIQRLASQQSQLQAVQQQNLIAQQQKQIQQLQQQQQYQSMQTQQSPYLPQQPIYNNPPIYQASPQPMYSVPLQTSVSVPQIPQTLYQQSRVQQQPQFFLHDQSSSLTPQRKTWAQQATPPPPPPPEIYQTEMKTWNNIGRSGSGFVLHDPPDRYDNKYQDFRQDKHYQNGTSPPLLQHSNSFTLSQQHQQQQHVNTSNSTPSGSPQHRNIHRQISQLLDESKRASPISLQQMDYSLRKSGSVTHAPIPAPPVDDMEPQSVSFIGNNSEDRQLSEGLSRINITSGSRTYRIPSPTRPPVITRNSFQASPPPETALTEISSLNNDSTNQKGFYIQFDDEPPKRPKPPLRTKRGSPRKERSFIETEKVEQKELEEERFRKDMEEKRREALVAQEREKLRMRRDASQEKRKVEAASALIIDNEEGNLDPDEAERRKKRILQASLQRKLEQEETKARKEHEAQARREREKAKGDEKARKKEEQAARRAAILEQYKLKKAFEEAEREGKVFDKGEMMTSLKPTPKMRPKAASRPRPKTIHIDSGSVEMAEGIIHSSRGKKGSTSNLTAGSMKRDYCRGSQDSLVDRSMGSGMLYKDSPDDSRGVSPCHSSNQTLGRHGSYKTSRGSSTDQDSYAYRYGDTDSGLGRATPPRRAPSPGMGSLRHLTSPSGPGSLPGLMTKGRRIFDDGASDISSTPSSMMDYNGPRLYKQPATKSNRGIMLNAVEYCVFPGVVNRDAKRRVLEEINKSESKHFLILFRDAGCQFRALYSYCPESEDVCKLYGTGPKQVQDRMFDKFFKYNSGGKCFSQVHTKHLTVTIDAFTIHNSLWQGKKVNLPNKKDMPLVI